MCSTRPPKNTDIQILRGFSILLVLAAHSWLAQNRYATAAWSFPGWVGVELFFVVSGFVVARSFAGCDFNVPVFFLKRAFRLYPSLILVLGCCLVINLYIPRWTSDPAILATFHFDEAPMLGRALSALGGLNPPPHTSYMLGPLWSLAVEMQFYLGFAFVVSAAHLVFGTAQEIKRALLFVAIALLAFTIACRLSSFLGFHPTIASVLIRRRIDFFCLGLIAALCDEALLRRLVARIWMLWPLLILWPLAMVTCSRLAMLPAPPVHDGLEGYVMPIVAFCFSLLVAIATQGHISRILGRRISTIAAYIGDRSYGLYILHLAGFMLSFFLVRAISVDWSVGFAFERIQLLISAIILLPAVELLYRFVERPGIVLGRRLERHLTEARPKSLPLPTASALG